ncbi:unnamed protein product [Nezara viridula]|uniref:DhaK domain-containing protein n=1 Tax=Nezara viridula TaxID=85310 RepID=A0A9P0HEN7_NEZVI|nr:unnamed protein product [Nezara viridula]
MCQKSAINSPETAVTEMLEGMSYAFPGLYIKPEDGIVIIEKDRGDKVALVCGCGAGYEPFAAGFVGEGMLTGYISGKMAKAPRAGVIFSVIKRLAELNKGGVLVLILNYSRDVLNFGLAIERARCIGLKVESVVLVDDCARWKMMRVQQFSNLAYKKGVAGSVFAFKILGALSSAGAAISHMVAEARNINYRLTTLGFVTEHFCFPGADKPAYTLKPKEVIIGMGMNGERGIKSIELTSARDVIRVVMSIILEEANLGGDSNVFVLVNRFTSMTVSEGYVIAKEQRRS